jgi:hypothetical protein
MQKTAARPSPFEAIPGASPPHLATASSTQAKLIAPRRASSDGHGKAACLSPKEAKISDNHCRAPYQLKVEAMAEADPLHSFAASRRDQLIQEEQRLRAKLTWYKGFSKVAVLAGIVVPVFAGSRLISDSDIFGVPKIYVAVAVLIAAALTAIHKGLDCEAYHTDCRHAIQALRRLEEGYEALITREGESLRRTFDDLEVLLRRYRERAFDLPPRPRARAAAVGSRNWPTSFRRGGTLR